MVTQEQIQKRVQVGATIQHIMAEKAFTRKHVSTQLGVNESLIWKIERGLKRVPKQRVDNFSQFFGIDKALFV